MNLVDAEAKLRRLDVYQKNDHKKTHSYRTSMDLERDQSYLE